MTEYLALTDKTFDELHKRQQFYSSNYSHSKNADDSYEKYYNYLKSFNSDDFDADKLFDTVKLCSDKYNYDDLMPVFATEYYPSAKSAGMSTKSSINYLIAILDVLADSGQQAMANDVISLNSKMLRKKEFNPNKYFENMSYKIPNFIVKLNQAYDNSKNKDDFLKLVEDTARYLHNQYSAEAFQNSDYPYGQKLFDQNNYEKVFVDELLPVWSSRIFKTDEFLSDKKQPANAGAKRRKQYVYGENPLMLQGFDKYNQISDLLENEFKLQTQYFPGKESSEINNENTTNNNSTSNNSNININFESGAFQFTLRNGDMQEVENLVRYKIVPSILDEYALLKGFA